MRKFMGNIRYRLAGFMRGRYGHDTLNAALIGTAIVLDVVFMLTRIPIFAFVSFVPLVLATLRMFSRNTQKRYQENRGFTNFFRNLLALRTHHIYRCPSCRQKIRIPRKGGKMVEITCPKCHEHFRKKI